MNKYIKKVSKTLGTKVNAAVNHHFRRVMLEKNMTESELFRFIMEELIRDCNAEQFLNHHDQGRPIGVQAFTLGAKVNAETFYRIKNMAASNQVSLSTLLRWGIEQHLYSSGHKQYNRESLEIERRKKPKQLYQTPRFAWPNERQTLPTVVNNPTLRSMKPA